MRAVNFISDLCIIFGNVFIEITFTPEHIVFTVCMYICIIETGAQRHCGVFILRSVYSSAGQHPEQANTAAKLTLF